MERWARTKLYDVLIAAPLMAYYLWVVWGLTGDVARLSAAVWGGEFIALMGLLNTVLTITFLSLIVVLVLVRRVPKAKSIGLMPRFAAIAGTFASLAITQMPYAELPLTVALLTMIPVLVGMAGAMVALAWLGRQASIMPEARGLVTSGPYAIVRHPLYLFEEIAIFGIALQHVQPWALIVFGLQLTLQLCRILYEEQVLSGAFPEYERYKVRTPDALIPRLY